MKNPLVCLCWKWKVQLGSGQVKNQPCSLDQTSRSGIVNQIQYNGCVSEKQSLRFDVNLLKTLNLKVEKNSHDNGWKKCPSLGQTSNRKVDYDTV